MTFSVCFCVVCHPSSDLNIMRCTSLFRTLGKPVLYAKGSGFGDKEPCDAGWCVQCRVQSDEGSVSDAGLNKQCVMFRQFLFWSCRVVMCLKVQPPMLISYISAHYFPKNDSTLSDQHQTGTAALQLTVISLIYFKQVLTLQLFDKYLFFICIWPNVFPEVTYSAIFMFPGHEAMTLLL